MWKIPALIACLLASACSGMPVGPVDHSCPTGEPSMGSGCERGGDHIPPGK